jgi:hypothetical protein
MTRKVFIDFIGISVALVKPDDRVVVGLIKERSHIHFAHFDQEDGGTVALLTGDYTVTVCKEIRTTFDPQDRLPDLAKLADVDIPNPELLKKAFGVRVFLPHGSFTALSPVLAASENPWSVAPKPSPIRLTDRCRFVGETDEETLKFRDHVLHPRGDHFNLTIFSLDSDVAGEKVKLESGLMLDEFALLYRCVGKGGPIPTRVSSAASISFDGDPGNPICPDGMLRVKEVPS